MALHLHDAPHRDHSLLIQSTYLRNSTRRSRNKNQLFNRRKMWEFHQTICQKRMILYRIFDHCLLQLLLLFLLVKLRQIQHQLCKKCLIVKPLAHIRVAINILEVKKIERAQDCTQNYDIRTTRSTHLCHLLLTL